MEHGGEDSQMSYVVPVGEDTLGTPDFNGGAQELRGGTYLVVQSTEDGTVINYTIQGTPYTRNMSRGESFVMQHIHQSDTVYSNKKVQVGLIGSGGESFDIRYFTLPDANFTGNDYWIPTFPSGYPVMNIRFHIYAITDANVTITTDSGVASDWNGKHLSALTVDPSFTTNGTIPVHISALEGQRILILISVDTGSGSRDWGYVPADSRYFAVAYYIPYAPSGKLNSKDMQLFVTPLFDGTIIYVDYDQDGVVDDNVTLNRLESWGFFDPADMDNTGTHLYSDFDFTVVYGETAYADSGGIHAGYDWGYTLIPLDYAHYTTALNVTKDVFPPAVPCGNNVTFTVTVKSGNYTISDVDVYDLLPDNFTYMHGSTTITHANGSVSHIDPSVNGQMVFWDLNEDMGPYKVLILEFVANVTDCPSDYYQNVVVANGTDPWGNVITPEAYAFIYVSSGGVITGTIKDVTDPTYIPVPGVDVALKNCTDDTLLVVSPTDGNGLYKFTELKAGEYCVFYNTSDPDLGFRVPISDDDPTEPVSDPLSTSADFFLLENGYYEHHFQVALPVDLVIEKTGPVNATMGQVITYNYTVTNEGDTDAVDVAVTDDVCGNATYVSGDADMDGEVDPGETWLFQCTHNVSLSDPNPLINTANVSTSDLDVDPSDNADDWSVTLFLWDMGVEKKLEHPPGGVAQLYDTVVFTVTITNLGNTYLLVVPLNDTYDPTKLDYMYADPPPNSTNEVKGVLLWSDLTGIEHLNPGANLTVEIVFTAIEPTAPNHTLNLATVVNASFGEFGNLTREDSAVVVIRAPAPVGGEVIPPDMDQLVRRLEELSRKISNQAISLLDKR